MQSRSGSVGFAVALMAVTAPAWAESPMTPGRPNAPSIEWVQPPAVSQGEQPAAAKEAAPPASAAPAVPSAEQNAAAQPRSRQSRPAHRSYSARRGSRDSVANQLNRQEMRSMRYGGGSYYGYYGSSIPGFGWYGTYGPSPYSPRGY